MDKEILLGDKMRLVLFRELKRLLIFLAIGVFLIVFNQDIGTWKYPMGFTQEWIERARFLGWLILAGAYPLSLLIRFFVYLLKIMKDS
jgi:uncharacterized membrane protein YoaT (DUF817 family)